VSRKTNEGFWNLIQEFKKRTDIPILLNTSFNNNVEPIVDSVEDAVVCLLTTTLHYVAIGNYLIEKKSTPWQTYLSLRPLLPAHISLHQVNKHDPDMGSVVHYSLQNSHDARFECAIQARVFRVLSLADGEKTLKDILAGERSREEDREIVHEMIDLWSRRLIRLKAS